MKTVRRTNDGYFPARSPPGKTLRLLILNGPNLNLLGSRETGIYGSKTLKDIEVELRAAFPDVGFRFLQDNKEGVLVDALQQAGADGLDGVVLNPGGYGHTSVALRDAIAAIKTPVVEVHISNVHAREDFRQRLILSGVCKGVILGLGHRGYQLAVRSLIEDALDA